MRERRHIRQRVWTFFTALLFACGGLCRVPQDLVFCACFARSKTSFTFFCPALHGALPFFSYN